MEVAKKKNSANPFSSQVPQVALDIPPKAPNSRPHIQEITVKLNNVRDRRKISLADHRKSGPINPIAMFFQSEAPPAPVLTFRHYQLMKSTEERR